MRSGFGHGLCWLYSNRVGAIEATSSAAIVQLKGRVTRGSVRRRLSEAPNSVEAPLQGTVITALSAATHHSFSTGRSLTKRAEHRAGAAVR